jgi:hypothetical protein
MKKQTNANDWIFGAIIVSIMFISSGFVIDSEYFGFYQSVTPVWVALVAMFMLAVIFAIHISFKETEKEASTERFWLLLFYKTLGIVGILFVLLYLVFIPIYFYQLIFSTGGIFKEGKTFDSLLTILLMFLGVVGIGIYKLMLHLVTTKVSDDIERERKTIAETQVINKTELDKKFDDLVTKDITIIKNRLGVVELDINGKAEKEKLKLAEAESSFALARSLWNQYKSWMFYYSHGDIEKIRKIDFEKSWYENLDDEGMRRNKGVLDEAILYCNKGLEAIRELEDKYKDKQCPEEFDFKNLAIKTKNNYAVFLATKASHNGFKFPEGDQSIAVALSTENFDKIKNIKIQAENFATDEKNFRMVYMQKATQILVPQVFSKGIPPKQIEAKKLLDELLINTGVNGIEKLKKSLIEDRDFILGKSRGTF